MAPYPFLRSNLEILEKENPSAYRWLKESLSSLGPSERLVRNSRGNLDWLLPTGKSLFESLTPRTAYKDWRIPPESEMGLSVIIGCNLGYGLNHLLPKVPCGHQLLVVEPNPDLLFACLGYTDYRPFLQTKKLVFLPPHRDQVRETMSRLVLPCLFGRIFLRTDLPSLQLGSEYALWADRCKEALEDLRLDIKTIRLFQDQIVQNELQNLRRASRDASPAGLSGMARGTTGVVLGAGPSLQRLAPALSAYRSRALFATSFQALPALQALELKPHFAMAIDATRSLLKVYEKLDASWAEEIPLVYSTNTCPEVLERYPGPTIPIWTKTGLACHIRNGKEPVLDTGGNVGVGLTRFLRWCGVDRLLLVGQDFSWSGASTHTENHLAGDHDFQFDRRLHIRMKNAQGQTVFTAQPYLTALGELERDLEGTCCPVFNLYGGGLPIKGSESITPDELESKVLIGDTEARVKKFVRVMSGELSPAKPFWQGRDSNWVLFFDSAKRGLKSLMRIPSPERQQVASFMDELLRNLQDDPLRKPYLTNEVINLAGLIYRSSRFGSRELEECKEIIEKAEKKMREMDRYLGDGAGGRRAYGLRDLAGQGGESRQVEERSFQPL